MTNADSGLHVVPVRVYAAVFVALLVLTGVTAAVSYVDLGPMSVAVALGIAVLKASLVVLIFMHVRYSARLVPLAIAAGIFWLLILVVLTLTDYWSRGSLGIVGH